MEVAFGFLAFLLFAVACATGLVSRLRLFRPKAIEGGKYVA